MNAHFRKLTAIRSIPIKFLLTSFNREFPSNSAYILVSQFTKHLKNSSSFSRFHKQNTSNFLVVGMYKKSRDLFAIPLIYNNLILK